MQSGFYHHNQNGGLYEADNAGFWGPAEPSHVQHGVILLMCAHCSVEAIFRLSKLEAIRQFHPAAASSKQQPFSFFHFLAKATNC